MSAERDVSTLVANATHRSVTADRLTELQLDGTQYLTTYPLVEYLREGEQPHFVLESPGDPVDVEGPDAPSPPVNDGSGKTVHMVTDMWWLTVAANDEEDQWVGVSLSDINGVSVGKRNDGSYEVSVSTPTYGLVAHVSKAYSGDTINALRKWLLRNTGANGTYRRAWTEGSVAGSDASQESVDEVTRGDTTVRDLVADAFHDSVTVERLTETKPGLTTRYLHTSPLVEYLEAGEQPHFVLAARDTTVSVEGSRAPDPPAKDGTGMVMHMVTDRRWLTVAANQHGDRWIDVPLSDINGVAVETGGASSHEVSFSTPQFGVVAPVGNMYDDADVEAVHSWLVQHTNADGTGYKRAWLDERTAELVSGEGGSPAPGELSGDPGAHMDADPQGAWVTPARIAKMGHTLDADEAVHYMFKGGTIDVEGSTSGTSLFGNDRDRKSAVKGIYTAVTDQRVVIHIPQFTGNDERHVPYSSVVSCDVDTGLVAKRLSLQTKGPTYHIQVNAPGKEELREATRFIRDQAEEANKTVVRGGESEPDPTEQLKNITELHEQGVLSDAEFEEKKQDLLDEI